jgi:hypothetical protein
MLDKVVSFEFGGEKLSLLLSYPALYTLESEFKLPLRRAYLAITEDLSVVAMAATLLCALEAHRKESPDGARAVKWTIADAQRIVMTLGPTKVAPILADAFTASCLPADAKAEDASSGKAGAGTESTGPASS